MRRITVLNSLLTLQLQLLYVVTCAGEALQLPAYQVDRKKKKSNKSAFSFTCVCYSRLISVSVREGPSIQVSRVKIWMLFLFLLQKLTTAQW